MQDFRTRQLELALRYGVNLPKPQKPGLDSPGFFVGASGPDLRFSPDGRYLYVPTGKGTFLWDVRERRKGARLSGLSNAILFAFEPDRGSVLLYNESWKFARFSVPDGDLIERFQISLKTTPVGNPCLGPDGSLLHLDSEGALVHIDASGKLRLRQPLATDCYNGAVHWLSDRQELWVSQTSMHFNPRPDAPLAGRHCALWCWRWPLDQHEPERVPGSWISLRSSQPSEPGQLWLTHAASARPPYGNQLDVLNLDTRQITRSQPCPESNLTSTVTTAHDMQAWALHGADHILMHIEGSEMLLPRSVCAVAFSPVEDLVVLAGDAGLVAPRRAIAGLITNLQVHADEAELRQRGYARMTTMPDKTLAPRIVVFARDGEWLLQSERADRVHYRPLDNAIRIAADAPDADLLAAIDAAKQRGTDEAAKIEPATQDEARHLVHAKVTPPAPGWNSAVAVVFASDTLDLWPMKPVSETDFEYCWYPLASLAPDTRGKELLKAIRSMLGCFKPRSKKFRSKLEKDRPAGRLRIKTSSRA